MANVEHHAPDGDLQHYAAEILHMEIVPGTEVMRDVDNVHFAHGGVQDTVYVFSEPSQPEADLQA